MDNGLSHRKFLRTELPFKPGSYIQDVLQSKSFGDTELGWIKLTKKGSVIFIMQQNCSACNYQPLIDFASKYTEFDYCLFLESDEDFYKDIIGKIKFPVLRCNVRETAKQLHFYGVPWVFSLNNMGQFISGDIFHNIEDLMRINHALIQVYYTR
ncbi:hypothetical protein C8Z91_34255 [Paenibacillus elgii]|uniref:Thioredoxin domain-containing protein n=1 Tax=Paenibacillus elgii TaxID=189691 RepID=A0A2T6FSP1_9BACL|nr:hypothetical protein [Paenibacillus elgii]PUA34932.1 hypothetical protein C8Z91_34255 [Paenibacillus elgii]